MSMATAEDGEAERITVRQAVQQHVVRLWDTDPTVAARAAESLFELGVKVRKLAPQDRVVVPFHLPLTKAISRLVSKH